MYTCAAAVWVSCGQFTCQQPKPPYVWAVLLRLQVPAETRRVPVTKIMPTDSVQYIHLKIFVYSNYLPYKLFIDEHISPFTAI